MHQSSITAFFKPQDPVLSTDLPSFPTPLLTASNRAVSCVQSQADKPVKRKCKPYKKYTPQQRLEVGKHATENGDASAMRKYALPEATARHFRNLYSTHLTNGNADALEGTYEVRIMLLVETFIFSSAK